jgi:hypothetical protein
VNGHQLAFERKKLTIGDSHAGSFTKRKTSGCGSSIRVQRQAEGFIAPLSVYTVSLWSGSFRQAILSLLYSSSRALRVSVRASDARRLTSTCPARVRCTRMIEGVMASKVSRSRREEHRDHWRNQPAQLLAPPRFAESVREGVGRQYFARKFRGVPSNP